MKAKELREKTNQELVKEKDKITKELSDLRFKKVLSVLENPSEITMLKKDISRINTIIHERALEKLKDEMENAQ